MFNLNIYCTSQPDFIMGANNSGGVVIVIIYYISAVLAQDSGTVSFSLYKQRILSILCFTGSLAGACNFNMPEDQWEAVCQLVQDQDDDFDWQIGHGGKYQGAGPSTDHSPGRCYSYSKLQLFSFNRWNLIKNAILKFSHSFEKESFKTWKI